MLGILSKSGIIVPYTACAAVTQKEKCGTNMKKKFRISVNAPVVLGFVLLCLCATVAGVVTNHGLTQMFFSVYRGSLLDPLTYVRLFTHVLGHGGFDHFIGNAMYLLLMGPMLEEKYGTKVLLKVILFTAVVTGIIHIVLFGSAALCGASGVVFAFIVLSSFTAFKEGEIPLTFILVVILFIGKEFYNGFTVIDNVSNLTHILGGVVGSVAGYKLNRKKK